VGRRGAAAVSAARTNAARLGALVIILRPLTGPILHAHRQLAGIGVEAGGAAG